MAFAKEILFILFINEEECRTWVVIPIQFPKVRAENAVFF
jgi:hypothetical protein